MQLNSSLHNRFQVIAPTILRIGIALVFLWFGFQQLIKASMWIKLIPQSMIEISNLSATTLVYLNGSFEIVFGLCLLLGFFTRTTAFLLSVHIINITFVVGYNAIGVRDFGLSMATIALFLYGSDSVSLDAWLMQRNSSKQSLDM